MTASQESLALAQRMVQAADIGSDIVVLDVSERLYITELFVIVTANSQTQKSAIVDRVEAALDEIDIDPIRREGARGEGQWALLDYGDVVVHVFDQEGRTFYALERLWQDCPEVLL